MTKYQKFLSNIDVISENDFNYILNSFGDIDIEKCEFGDLDVYDYSSEDAIARVIIDNTILSDYKYAFVDDIDYFNKTITIEDVNNLSDLEQIKSRLSNWNILNYNDIVEYLENEEVEKEELNKKYDIIDYFKNLDFDKLNQIYKYAKSI